MIKEVEDKQNPLKTIRKKCLDCCCESYVAVKTCSVTKCDLWYYRFGKRPETVAKQNPKLIDKELFRINIKLSVDEMNKILG